MGYMCTVQYVIHFPREEKYVSLLRQVRHTFCRSHACMNTACTCSLHAADVRSLRRPAILSNPEMPALRQAEDPVAQAALEAQRARLRGLARVQAADAALVAEPDEGRSLRPASQALDQVQSVGSLQPTYLLHSRQVGKGKACR
jgi:hypothetical protein